MPFVTAGDGIRVHYRAFGPRRGAPVLLLAGLGSDHRSWALQRAALGRHHRCLAVDNRGTGRSDVPTGPYSLERMAADAGAVLDHAGIERAHVIGASMGGALAVLLAASDPERVRSLVLCCTSGRLDAERRALLERWAADAAVHGVRSVLHDGLDHFVGPRSIARRRPFDRLAARVGAHASIEGFVGQCQALLAAPDHWIDRLDAITAPTLVLVGEHDALTPLADAERLAARIPRARLLVVPRAGHVVMLERPVAFNRAVRGFLEGSTRSDRASSAAVAISRRSRRS